MRKLKKNEHYDAVEWFLSKLVPPELAEQIKYKIYFRTMKADAGRCWAYRHHPMLFTIVINTNLTRKQTLRILAHECVHVMQHATGKMKDLWGKNNGKVLWKNKMIKVLESGKPHFDQPWEKEAYARQESLLNSYLNYVRREL